MPDVNKVLTDPTRQQWAGDTIAKYARVLYRLGFINEANRNMSRAADLVPQSPVLAEIRGFQHMDAGRYEMAEQQFAIARRTNDPVNISAQLLASHALAFYWIEDYDKAAAAFGSARQATKQPTYALAYTRFQIGCYLNNGKTNDVKTLLSQYKTQLEKLGADPERDLRIAAVHETLRDVLRWEYRYADAKKQEEVAKKIRTTVFGSDPQLNEVQVADQFFPGALYKKEIVGTSRDNPGVIKDSGKSRGT